MSARSSRRRALTGGVKRTLAPSLASGAALATAAAVGSVAATQPQSVASAPVEPAALIVVGSSTNPTGDGIREFYGGKFEPADGQVTTVNFWTGPPGIYQGIEQNIADDDTVVLSSGWGAANISLLLTYLKATGSNDPVLTNPKSYVLDNNVATPNGGYGTRLPAFVLLGVNPIPTPTDPGVPVVNVVYEYDINSNIPAYLWNGPAYANSLMAYFDRRLNQDELYLPVDDEGNPLDADGKPLPSGSCEGTPCRVRVGVDDEGEPEYARVLIVEDTTYVSYESNRLPLVEPLRLLGEPGDMIADAVEPAARAVVDYGYPYNDPLAAPDEYIPARVLPRPGETATFVKRFTDGVREGLETVNDDAPATPGLSESRTSGAVTVGTNETPDPAPTIKRKPPISVVKDSLNFTPKTRGERTSSGRGSGPISRAIKASLDRLTKRTAPDNGDADTDGGSQDPASAPIGSPAPVKLPANSERNKHADIPSANDA